MANHLSKNLLFAQEDYSNNSMLNGTNAKGSYNTMQFVLRLRSDVRNALNNHNDRAETIQASSTLLHETIHWWQHIGSNFGFLFSLAYPAFAHFTKQNFDNIIKQDLSYKSIIKFDQQYYEKYNLADITDINVILNTYFDLEYAKQFALDNKNINSILEDRRFFLTIGHCYHIFWSSTVETLASTVDRTFEVLPNTNNWVSNFTKLKEERVTGFYIDSPNHISLIGIKAIYEGQAIFNQMQYLTVALNPNLTYNDFKKVGMLYGIYEEAYEYYLYITKLEKPQNLLSPIIGLFLLICDISINPTNGFPLEIYDYENFINLNDPGIRFTNLCKEVASRNEYYINQVNGYTKDEYIKICKEL